MKNINTKLFIGLALLSLLPSYAFAFQSDTTYYRYNGFPTDKAVAAYYELNNGRNRQGYVEQFYKDHSSYGFVNYFDNVWEGSFARYYKSGAVRESGMYSEGSLIGVRSRFYENGQKKMEETQDGVDSRNHLRLINAWDSLGNQTVNEGTGYFKGELGIERHLVEEGALKDGHKIGQWKGHIKERLRYEEEYDAEGKLTRGVGYDEAGKAHEYEYIEELGSFPGGPAAWTKFLRKNLKYPKKARRTNTEGPVFLSFTINKDGSISDIQELRSPSPLLTESAISTLSISPNWIPMKQRGLDVRSRMNIQIVYRLR